VAFQHLSVDLSLINTSLYVTGIMTAVINWYTNRCQRLYIRLLQILLLIATCRGSFVNVTWR